MMQAWQLPSELQQLESDLSNRSLGEVSATLRRKVLDDVRSQLRIERSHARWQFAAAVAAVVLVWMNLSMSAIQATDFGFRCHEPSESIETIVQRIQQLVPDISAGEAQRQAILLRAGSNLVCYPDLSRNYDTLNRTNVRRLFRPEDDHEKWGE